MSFSCFKASNADITRADLLYLPDMNDQSLWESNDPTPHCSSVSPPAPSQCLGCFQESLYAVCSKRLEKIPIMEGDGKHINVTKSECPTFHTEADPAPADYQTLISILPVIIIPLIVFILILCVVIHKRRRICSKFQAFREKIFCKTKEDDADHSDSPSDPFPL